MPRVRFPLLGVTASGKTFNISSVIETVLRPTLVLASNKTFALELQEAVRLCDEIGSILSAAFAVSPRKAG